MQEHKTYDFAYVETLEGWENMKRDLENLIAAEEWGRASFRLYRWKENTLSIGYSQESPHFAIPVVKRPTGGGALLHGQDLSFSYAGRKGDWGGSFVRIYRNFMGRVLHSLRELLPDLEMSSYRGGYEDYFCYFYPTLGEITYRGKKVLACAMRVLKEAFLIHGSLFIDMDYDYFEKLTGIEKDRLKERMVTLRELGVEVEGVLGAMTRLKTELEVS
ncbi:MAG: lipoate--protein ligase [Aquificaceae bacterium]|nr:lipoate--protein ligase [Aquificaceae bacterium]